VPPVLHVQAAAGLGDADDDDEAGGRKGNQFKSHLKKSEAASEFSRTKTIAQQRRSLPVYTVRDELLQVCEMMVWRGFAVRRLLATQSLL
jgi:hypothetical protein